MFRATQTPPLSYMLDDLLTRDDRAIARHLGISTRTLDRWRADDQAPRAAMLALFWETRWGYSQVDADLYNAAQVYRQESQGLQRLNAALRVRIARLEALGSFGAANAPTLAAL